MTTSWTRRIVSVLLAIGGGVPPEVGAQRSLSGRATTVEISDLSPSSLVRGPAGTVTGTDSPAALAPVSSTGSLATAASNVGAARGNVIVVCCPALLPSLARWIHYRQSQGYRTVQVDGRLSHVEILRTIREFAQHEKVRAVVLVGDADLTMFEDPAVRERSVPTFFVPARINAALGAEPDIATDAPYADLDGDQIPDVPIGRLSVDNGGELTRLVDRLIRYEQTPHHGDWRRTIHMAAAVGDFGVVADSLIETAAKKFLVDGIPAAYRTTMTYGNWRSPFCPDPRMFRQTMLDQVNEGCLFWVYMGHGRPSRLDRFQVGESVVPVLEAGDVARFRSQAGSPIAILLACYTGAFEQPQDCLAERLLRNTDGPVAVLAASRITMPYSMAILGMGWMEAYFQSSPAIPPRLGDIVLSGKRALAESASSGMNRKLMDSLARALSPTKEQLPQERLEHQFLFNLLGDPLLVVHRPPTFTVTCPDRVAAGEPLLLRGESPLAGQCQVELVCRRDRLTFTPPRRKLPSGPDTEATFDLGEMNKTYYMANDFRWNEREFPIQAGRFAIQIQVPPSARGFSHARLVVQGAEEMVIASTDVYVSKPGEDNDLRKSNAAR